MTLAWLFRGVALGGLLWGLASAGLTLLVVAALPLARRVAGGLRPRGRARVLLALRLGPTAGAALLVLGAFLPAYALFEPAETGERTGPALLVLALVAVAPILFGVRRAVESIRATRALHRRWREGAVPLAAAGFTRPALCIRDAFPVVSVVGVLRPRLYIAGQVIERLGSGSAEMEAVLAHEAGHLAARDNLKSFLVRACMDWLTPLAAGRRLEAEWRHAADVAADEHAGSGAEPAAAALASALLELARLTPRGARLGLAATALPLWRGDGAVAERVRRLLGPRPGRAAAGRSNAAAALGTAAVLAALAALATHPRALTGVLQLAETLLHRLS